MATSSATVTIDKVYFETLLRRAELHTSGVDFTTPATLSTVTIPKVDHDNLLKSAREYENLRRSLYKGGITNETLDILINDDIQNLNPQDNTTSQTTNDDTSDGGVPCSLHPDSFAQDTTISWTGKNTYGQNGNYLYPSQRARNRTNSLNNHSQNYSYDECLGFADTQGNGFHESGNSNGGGGQQQGDEYKKNARRTVQLSNLPGGVTHADVVDAVRGGMLLDIYLRNFNNDRVVQISFLEEAGANDFFRYCKRHDIYIRGRRAEISWADRQFTLPHHVANKIAMGATRNIVVHNIAPRHTEKSIRDDLEHIHNLTVIKVQFFGQNAHISTNSVHNAMFARTCMMSRSTYKGSKIEWGVDQCDTPLEIQIPISRKQNGPPPKKTVPINRFELLNIDGTGDGSVDGDHDTSFSTSRTVISTSTAGIAI